MGKPPRAQKKGFYSLAFPLIIGGYLVTDTFRHLLLLFKTDEHSIIELDITNPVNSNRLGISNHRVAEIAFWTSTVMIGSFAASLAKTYLGAHTIIVSTKYAL